jgi:hypothetical protein
MTLLTKLGIFAVDPIKLPELDAYHVLRAFAHLALFARGFHQARDQLRRLRGVFDVGDHVGMRSLPLLKPLMPNEQGKASYR